MYANDQRKRTTTRTYLTYAIAIGGCIFLVTVFTSLFIATLSSSTSDLEVREDKNEASIPPVAVVRFPWPRVCFFDGKYSYWTVGRKVFEPEDSMKRRKHPPDSKDKSVRPAVQIYSVPAGENSTKEDCVPMKQWQVSAYPTCNSMHEMNLFGVDTNSKLLGQGTIRSAWEVDVGDLGVVMKTLQLARKDTEFDQHHYQSSRRDAMASEHLTSSPHVVDIYSFCSQSCVNEMLKSNLEKFHKKKPSSIEKLRVARDAAIALADVHTVDGKYATIVHRDVTHRNFLLTRNGTLKLNDFNVGRFPEWDSKANTPCGFHKNDCTAYRSPEECRHDVLSEKIDIYMLSNTLYYILTGHQPLRYPKRPGRGKVKGIIISGKTSTIPQSYEQSHDPAVTTLVSIIQRCRAYDPVDRPNAQEVADVLARAFDALSS